MGYQTEFEGSVQVEPPLNAKEIEYLQRFAATRRMDREKGPYYANPGSDGFGQDHEPDIRDYNHPPKGQPGLWCKWEPSDDGETIAWNGHEKFYDSVEWMRYLIDTFLKEGCWVQRQILARERSGLVVDGWDELEQFRGFTFDHVVNGVIEAQGEEAEDRWRLVVRDNAVTDQRAKLVWED